MTRNVVVIRSGGFGAATAYFLTRRGGRRVARLDRHSLASQTFPRAAGNAAVLRSTEAMTRLASRAVEWLLRFSAATGEALDLDDTIRRLQAFEQAGADVLYAPGLRDLATIRTVVLSVGKPVNVVVSTVDPAVTAAQLAEVGVKRISVGGSLSRLALAAFLEGAREMRDRGRFTWLRDAVPSKELRAIFTAKA